MLRTPRSVPAVAFILGLAFAPASAVAAGKVALPKIAGPSKGGPDYFERALVKAFAELGFEVADPAAMKAAARGKKGGPEGPAAAEAVGADARVVGKVRKFKGNAFRLTIELLPTAGKDVLESAVWNYKRGKDWKKSYEENASSAAAAIAKKFAPHIQRAAEARAAVAVTTDPPDDASALPEPKGPPPDRASPPEDGTVRDTDPTPAPTDANPQLEAARRASSEIEEARPTGPLLLRIGAGGGSQGQTAYTVTVGGAATAIAYRLGPALMFGGDARLTLPDTTLSFDARFSYVASSFELNTQPATIPTAPRAAFVKFGAGVAYGMELANLSDTSKLTLEPVLGLLVDVAAVEGQAPDAVVLGATTIAPELGAITRLVLDSSLELEADLRFRVIAAYSEQPTTTGDSGFGVGLEAAAVLRYWASREFGFGARLGYEFHRIGFTGTGTRLGFFDDPPLTDAAILASRVQLAVQVYLGL